MKKELSSTFIEYFSQSFAHKLQHVDTQRRKSSGNIFYLLRGRESRWHDSVHVIKRYGDITHQWQLQQ